MKLRIRGNSIRLRLTRAEVGKLAAGETVSESIDLMPIKLTYELCTAVEASQINATFAAGCLTVSIPERQAREWAMTGAIGLEALAGKISILVEKDFACVNPRFGEDESDMFEHPDAAGKAC